MGKIKIPYTEPTSSQDELQIKEIVAGTYLKDRVRTIYNNRYGEVKTEYDVKSLYEISEGEVHYKVASSTAQMAYLPEYSEGKSPNFPKLTFTPPIGKLQYIGKFDFYGGSSDFIKEENGLKDFPFGIVAGNYIHRIDSITGYNGSFDALAIGTNAVGNMVFNETLKGKNINTYRPSDYPPVDYPDGFYVVLLGDDLKHIKTLSYPAFEYKDIIMDFYNDNLFLVGIGELSRGGLSGLKKNIAVSIEGNVVFKEDIEDSFIDFKYFKTYKYILAYSHSMFLLVNKTNGYVAHIKLNENMKNLVFNPVLRTICVVYNNEDVSVYKFYADSIENIKQRQPINPENKKYTKQWRGNLDYDYSVKDKLEEQENGLEEQEHRGHYLKEIGEYEADYEIGLFITIINTNSFSSNKGFFLNNTDDADISTTHYLRNRRFKTKLNPKITLTTPSYVRMYKTTRQIVFYSTEYDNDKGVLYLFKY